MSKGKTIVVGGDGKVGGFVYEYLSQQGHDVAKTTRKPSQAGGSTIFYDGSTNSIGNIISLQPTTVVWAIGASGYALCRDKREECHWANVIILEEFLAEAQGLANFIFLSSTSVFDAASGVYKSTSPTAAVSEYGKQKAVGEQAIQSSGVSYSILRLGKVLTPCWPLLANWKKAVADGVKIEAFSNLSLSPIFPLPIAQFIESILPEGESETFHCSHHKALSYLEFAHSIVKMCGGDPSLVEESLCRLEMTDGGAGDVDIVPSKAWLQFHFDPMSLPLEEWFS